MEATQEVSPVDAATSIEQLRAQIDLLDDIIIELVAGRERLSKQIQRQRLAAGGTRHKLAREKEIFARYNGKLGAAGNDLAEIILKICRGKR